MAKKQRKVRTDLRKNRGVRTRQNDLTRTFSQNDEAIEDASRKQSVSGKGDLTRKRTVVDAEIGEDASGMVVLPAIDTSVCEQGRVLRVQGLHSAVQLDNGEVRLCATRRLLKTLTTDQRHVVAAGDRVGSVPRGKAKGLSSVSNQEVESWPARAVAASTCWLPTSINC